MFTSLEATRLWMLALCLALIPIAVLWESILPPASSMHRHQTILPALPRPLMMHIPFVVAVLVLTFYLVVVMVSNTL